MAESWDDYAAEWDTNDDVVHYSEQAYASLSDVVNLSNLRVLDFGCGTGLLTEKLSPLAKEVIAIDSSEKMISILKKKNLYNVTSISTELTEQLIAQNNLFSEKFDLIVASSVCSFLPDYGKTLNLIKSLLVNQGVFVQWDWLKTEENSEFSFSYEDIKNAFTTNKLHIVEIKTAFMIEHGNSEMPVIMGVAKKQS